MASHENKQTSYTNTAFEDDSPKDMPPEIKEFTNIALGENPPKKHKLPKRILHFSDGILEEYSTDEEEEEPPPPPPVDPRKLNWLPWFWHYMVTAGVKALNAADFCGEKLAWFFGITSPKYQYALDEYHRMKKEEKEESEREEREKEAEKERKAKYIAEMESGDSSVGREELKKY